MSDVGIKTHCNSIIRNTLFLGLSIATAFLFIYAPASWAADPPLVGLGKFAENINVAIPTLTTLVASIGFFGGITFAIIGIIKFKHHKENPQQTPLGTPITLILVAAGLTFLPTMLDSTGETLTGAKKGEAGAAVRGSPSKDATTKIWN